MQQTDGTVILDQSPDLNPEYRTQPPAHQPSRRGWFAVSILVLLLLLALVPPLVSLSRYQHRVAASMSQVLGRPVHLDRVRLSLLPLPSFTLENLVIEEAPAFGAEPLVRASTVNARLRLSSLWRHRVEFSRITFIDPSVNLVLNPDGRWNLEDILLQTAHIETAPTSQARAGQAPRFPYIEATGGRVNLKIGREKTPFSLTEADFALWLPEPRVWQMRIRAHPARTDTSASDTGIVQLEATLHRASSRAQVPIDLDATWIGAPLGEASRILVGHDAGFRGSVRLSTELHGLLSSAQLQLRLELANLHRADFVPEHTLDIDLSCAAHATNSLHSLEDLRCSWPVPDSGESSSPFAGVLSDTRSTVALTGSIPDLLSPLSAQLQVGTAQLPASVLLTWLRVLSARVPPSLAARGLFSATASIGEGAPGWHARATLDQLILSGARLGDPPIAFGPLELNGSSPRPLTQRSGLPRSVQIQLTPTTIDFGGETPANLDASATDQGYTAHLTGLIPLSRLLALGSAVPQIGDGLAAALPTDRASGPVRLDLTAHRDWGGPQIWTETEDDLPASSVPPHHAPRSAPRATSRRRP